MTYITNTLTIVITLFNLCKGASSTANYAYEYPEFSNDFVAKDYTRNITIKQGVLRGLIVEPRVNRHLPSVEQYKGIPYAAAPVGEMRFMPPGSAPSWFGVKNADAFSPVCPQNFPNEKLMTPDRRAYFLRLKEHLMIQNEDCLYLNIYAPLQERRTSSRKYPVMIFLHGESFEWNSGNPYDGSVLAASGNVIVVTLNYRLGILGFLQAGLEDHAKSNFGLIDQIAALLWVKENIDAFGGNAASVTLFGHGTGAVCASLLMLSPLQANEMLFHRVILMGGTALSDWALVNNPSMVTYQVAVALNCQMKDDIVACLRRKPLDELLSVSVKTAPFRTRFGPVVDSVVVPNEPKKSMTQYVDIFKRFELMYGVTELDSIHLLDPVALTHGMLERERDEELRNYVRSRCEMEPELCLARTLAQYTEESQEGETKGGMQPSRATVARDALLDILSDARTVAPIVQTGRYHAALNLQSYFYVFNHRTSSKDNIRNMSYNGDELPFVFGVPLDGPKYHFVDQYTQKERLFSEIVMMYFTNFAYTGNPNVPRKSEFYTLNPADWYQYDIEWPEFDIKQERYLQLKIPPQPSTHYRSEQVIYWNDIFPELALYKENKTFKPNPPAKPPKGKMPPWILYPPPSSPPRKVTITKDYRKYENFFKPLETQAPKDSFGVIKNFGPERPYNIKQSYGVVVNSPDEVENVKGVTQSSSSNILLIVGLILLVLVNIAILGGFYYKCYKAKRKNNLAKVEEHSDSEDEKHPKLEDVYMENGCNFVKIMSRSSKSDETYEAVKTSEKKTKLTRQTSNSTIDAHTKVRDWITQEIVNKYSPKFLRRPKQNFAKIGKRKEVNVPVDIEKDSTLGRSPTRPVSPTEDVIKQEQPLLQNKKSNKVSVAIDATPSGRGASVLMQQPIELTKSLDCPLFHPETPLRRSITLEDFSPRTLDYKKELRKSTTSINLKFAPEIEPTIIKIEHNHSNSEPVEDIYGYTKLKKLKTFDPNADVNVTSRDEISTPVPLTPEESLITIKRRNFPKVLPDHPGREALAHKRRSMPAHCLFLPIPENSSFSQPNSPSNKSLNKFPPAPPPRTTTLERQNSLPQKICVSEPMLAEEPPMLPEPEVTFNNLYVGPLIPKNRKLGPKQDSQQSFDSLKSNEDKEKLKPKTVITPNGPIKRADPKYVVKPTMTRKGSDPVNKHIPRVVVPDNQPQIHCNEAKDPDQVQKNSVETEKELPAKLVKPKVQKSHIPTLVKPQSTKESSSSESSPSEESDTGTVVKRI